MTKTKTNSNQHSETINGNGSSLLGNEHGHSPNLERQWKRSDHGYVHRELTGGDQVEVRVEFRINNERLGILEKILDLKVFGGLSRYVSEALYRQIENDLKSPETIANDYCQYLLKSWVGYPARHGPRLTNEIDR